MGLSFADFFAQRHAHGLRENQPFGEVEILAHALRIDLQGRHDGSQVVDGAPCQLDDVRQNLPLGMPTTQPAFVFLHHRREQAADKSRHAHCRRQNHRRTDGIALVRHCGGTAAALVCGFKDFPYFGLHVQSDVPRNFSRRAGA